jgi:hypothetical protein
LLPCPGKGAPELYVKLANPNQVPQLYRLRLDKKFWAGCHIFSRPNDSAKGLASQKNGAPLGRRHNFGSKYFFPKLSRNHYDLLGK